MKHRYALIVGIYHYNDESHFIPLPLVQADARALYELLVDPERGGWLSEDVIYLTGDKATRDEIESQLRELCLVHAQQDDLVLLYFAGHALIDQRPRMATWPCELPTRIVRPPVYTFQPLSITIYMIRKLETS